MLSAVSGSLGVPESPASRPPRSPWAAIMVPPDTGLGAEPVWLSAPPPPQAASRLALSTRAPRVRLRGTAWAGWRRETEEVMRVLSARGRRDAVWPEGTCAGRAAVREARGRFFMIQRGRVGGLHGGPVQAIGNAVPFMDRPESSGRNRLQRTAVWPGGSQGDVVKKSRAFWAGCGVCETLEGWVAARQGQGGGPADGRDEWPVGRDQGADSRPADEWGQVSGQTRDFSVIIMLPRAINISRTPEILSIT